MHLLYPWSHAKKPTALKHGPFRISLNCAADHSEQHDLVKKGSVLSFLIPKGAVALENWRTSSSFHMSICGKQFSVRASKTSDWSHRFWRKSNSNMWKWSGMSFSCSFYDRTSMPFYFKFRRKHTLGCRLFPLPRSSQKEVDSQGLHTPLQTFSKHFHL